MTVGRPQRAHRVRRGAVLTATVGLTLVITGCTADPRSPAPSPSVTSPAPSTSSVEAPEPTTTNTLPPPPVETKAPAQTAGPLNAGSLPVPDGWRTAVLDDSEENGTKGNGSWVHARDPRYAAQDVITIGCAEVTRDDYTDPTAALEGNYVDAAGGAGIGLVLDFGAAAAATRYLELYRTQVQACVTPGGPVQTTIVGEPGGGLIDRRVDSDTSWLEVVKQTGTRVTLVILGDPGGDISAAEAQELFDRID